MCLMKCSWAAVVTLSDCPSGYWQVIGSFMVAVEGKKQAATRFTFSSTCAVFVVNTVKL